MPIQQASCQICWDLGRPRPNRASMLAASCSTKPKWTTHAPTTQRWGACIAHGDTLGRWGFKTSPQPCCDCVTVLHNPKSARGADAEIFLCMCRRQPGRLQCYDCDTATLLHVTLACWHLGRQVGTEVDWVVLVSSLRQKLAGRLPTNTKHAAPSLVCTAPCGLASARELTPTPTWCKVCRARTHPAGSMTQRLWQL